MDHRPYGDRLPSAGESAQWFDTNCPPNGYGTKPGFKVNDHYLIIIDLDSKCFESQYDCDAALFQLLEDCPPLASARIETTRSGGYHIWVWSKIKPGFVNFKLSPDGSHVGELLGGKDAAGFCVVAPTAGYGLFHDGDPVAIDDWGFLHPCKSKSDSEPAPLPAPSPKIEGIPDLSEFFGPTAKNIYDSPATPDDRSNAIATVLNEAQGWINWLDANRIQYNGSLLEIAYHLGQRWECSGKISRILPTIAGDVTPAAVHRGGDDAAWKKVRSVTPSQYPQPALNRRLRLVEPVEPEPETVKHQNQLTMLIDVLRETFPDLYWDEFSSEPKIPGRNPDDLEPGQLRLTLATERGIKAAKEDIADAVVFVARQNPKNPIREYLEQCHQRWGTSGELDTIASRYFGAGGIYDVFMRKTLIAAVARALNPGCKQETITVLQDPRQGSGKSDFWRFLTPDGYFDSSLRFDTQRKYEDIVSQFHRFWISEWGEIDSVFRKRESSFIKGFLSTQSDTIRRPYARHLVDMKRPCIFVGSTNQSEFLSDATGERRYWVIPVRSDRIPVERLEAERDQLWAAAYAAYIAWDDAGRPRSACPYWLSPAEDSDAAAIASEFSRLDPWEFSISEYVENRDQVTVGVILDSCLKIDLSRQTGQDASRVGDILKRLGWQSRRIRHNGRRPTIWFPPTAPDQGWIRGGSGGAYPPPDPPLAVDVPESQTTGSPGSPQNAQNFPPSTNAGGCSDLESFEEKRVIRVIHPAESQTESGVNLDQGGGGPPLIHPRSTPDPRPKFSPGDDVKVRTGYLTFGARLIERLPSGWRCRPHYSKQLKAAGIVEGNGMISILDSQVLSKIETTIVVPRP